jgi:nitrile hydratase accessory protein
MRKVAPSLEDLMKARGIGATFAEPWEARAFALALDLAERGAFQWEDFRQRLIAEIARADAEAAQGQTAPDYYECWLAALETLLTADGLASPAEIDRYAEQIAANPALRNKALASGPIKIA